VSVASTFRVSDALRVAACEVLWLRDLKWLELLEAASYLRCLVSWLQIEYVAR